MRTPSIKFIPIGGAGEVGANLFYLNIAGTGFVLDCGMHPRKKGLESIPDFGLLNDVPIDFAIITHAHSDHLSALPFLIRKFPHIRIFTTTQTKEIASITLHNSAKLLKELNAGVQNFKPYTHEEIELLVQSIQDYSYNTVFEVAGLRHNSSAQIKICFFDAGHILGAAGISIEFEGNKIFYTGDIRLSEQVLLVGAKLPETDIDTLILETTYGAVKPRKANNWKAELQRLALAANKILEKGGSVLIPVFALGKTQELLAGISELMRKGVLTETPIYTGGIGKEITRIYDSNRFLVRRKLAELELRKIQQENLYGVKNFAYFLKHSGIVLAPGGMMDKGTISYKLAMEWIKNENFAIYAVGYMDTASPGFKILKAERGKKIEIEDGIFTSEKKCAAEWFYLPTHADRNDLLSIVDKLKPKKVILVHGEPEAVDWMGYNIIKDFPGIKVFAAVKGREIDLSKT